MKETYFDLEKIHQVNDIEWAKHELIWSMLGKYRIYIRINETEAKFLPFYTYPSEANHLFNFVQQKFQELYFFKKIGILDTLFIIESELKNLEIKNG